MSRTAVALTGASVAVTVTLFAVTGDHAEPADELAVGEHGACGP